MFKTQITEPQIVKNSDGTFRVQYQKKWGWFSTKTFYLCHDIDAMEAAGKGMDLKAIAKRQDCETAHWNDCFGDFNFERHLLFKSETQAKLGLSVFLDMQKDKAMQNIITQMEDLRVGNFK